MAIALVASTATGTAANGGTTSGIDTTGANLIVAMVSYNSGTEVTTSHLSDNKSNTWTALTQKKGGSGEAIKIFYSLSPTVGSGHTLTVSLTNSKPALSLSSWSGVDSFDAQSTGNSVFSTSGTAGSITPANNDSLLISGTVHESSYNASGATVDSGYTELAEISYGGTYFGAVYAYLIQGTAAAVNPTYSWTNTASSSLQQAAFAPAGSGPAMPVFRHHYNTMAGR